MENAELQLFFLRQIRTLINLNVPAETISVLMGQKDTVISRASEMDFSPGNLFFLPVIPWMHIMGASPYYIFDVEGGEGTRGMSREAAAILIEERGRVPLSDLEIISLSLHAEIFLRHYKGVSGYRYCTDDVPGVCLGIQKSGFLCRFFFECAIDHCGVPSHKQA